MSWLKRLSRFFSKNYIINVICNFNDFLRHDFPVAFNELKDCVNLRGKDPAALYLPKGTFLNSEDIYICENCRHFFWCLLCEMLPEALLELCHKAEEPPRVFLKVLGVRDGTPSQLHGRLSSKSLPRSRNAGISRESAGL